MTDIQTKLDYAIAVADWFLDLGDVHFKKRELEDCLKCLHVAGAILAKQNRDLVSARLEEGLRAVADYLPENAPSCSSPSNKTEHRKTCLHVLNEALPAGGLTAMAVRWIKNDSKARVHHVALLSQETPVPDNLIKAVREANGVIHKANPAETLVGRAVWLRNLARDLADYVVLHIGLSDVICGAAFGSIGGPPIMLVNHAAHVFWIGTFITDLLINCRGSALEGLWAVKYRGVSRYSTVPIPLQSADDVGIEVREGYTKDECKIVGGIPTNAKVLLTVGAFFKYSPIGDLDFLNACETILTQLSDVYLLAVGFRGDSRWNQASERVGGRILALGTMPQSELARIHKIADIYIEGFPFGTTTALLEAGLTGMPVVLAPARCPPPYGSDGIALDKILERPGTVEDYKNKIIALLNDPDDRKTQGDMVRNAIGGHHTGIGWKKHLEDTLSLLPLEHSTYSPTTAIRTPDTINAYWTIFSAQIGSNFEETLEHSITRALSMGLKPRLTKTLWRFCKKYKSLRRSRTVPLPLLVVICNCLFPVLPATFGAYLFRSVSFLCRASLPQRMRKKAKRIMGRAEPVSGYEAYRHIEKSGFLQQTEDRTARVPKDL